MDVRMSRIAPYTSALEDVWVALDLETTGLWPDNDDIIEVGAVRFQGDRVLDTFQTFVNPGRRLSDFIKRYTGIRQRDVDGAPPFKAISGQLASFVGSSPIIGHNLGFDLGFLSENGLDLRNPRSDTWEMAYVLLPEARDYSLGGISASLDIAHPQPHRADADALVTQRLFVKLAGMALELDANTLAEMGRLAARSPWVLSYLLRGIEAQRIGTASPQPTAVGVDGVDTGALKRRLKRVKSLRPNKAVRELDVDLVASLLSKGSPLAKAVPAFEERSQQVAMTRAIAEAINEGKRLIVEAGTGVGKSLAYLLPAALYALDNNKRIVISTNTINLQEQLLTKDIPTLVEGLAGVERVPTQDLRFTQLKGRANYLCVKRWAHLRSLESLSGNEARMLAKTLVWLQSTATGDRSELNLGGGGTAAAWDRLSAQGARGCPASTGPCFLRAARERAAAAHVVVVNHALLMSDITAGGTLIPPHDILIIDEAHHLEEEATRHLGFEVGQAGIDDRLQSLSGERGLLREVIAAFRGASAKTTRRETVEKIASQTAVLLPEVRERMSILFASLGRILDAREGEGVDGSEARITSGMRAQPDWSELEIVWQHADVVLAELGNSLRGLDTALDGLEDSGLINYEGLMMEMANHLQSNAEQRQRLKEVIPNPKSDGIYWATRGRRDGNITLHSAPLQVGEQLDHLLYSRKDCVVLTGATLSANESFQHIVDRTGFKDADELLLGSPFDYPRVALVCVPEDMPEPSSPGYQAELERAITDAAVAAGGRTMALFTSHASLQAAAAAVRGDLEAQGINVLAQGIDGTPHRILSQFLEDRSSLLLGTASFWEGVDLAGESLEVLLLSRLPFSVPTDPVFAARSELFESPFMEYAVPQAVLRLRQGFGRLIRTKSDRGVVVILDRRIISRGYGKAFLDSLPQSTFHLCRLDTIGEEIRSWVGR